MCNEPHIVSKDCEQKLSPFHQTLIPGRLCTHPILYQELPRATWHESCITRVGQNRIHTPYMTVYLVIPLPEMLYMHLKWLWQTLQAIKQMTMRAQCVAVTALPKQGDVQTS